MRKSERLRQLELTVVRMEMHIELLNLAINNLLESQSMQVQEQPKVEDIQLNPFNSLQAGKWYPTKSQKPLDN